MPAMYLAALVVGGAGVITALGLISIRQMTDMPSPVADGSDDWLYAEMTCIWWDEGACWTVRHV